jgi:hypothetical protein
MRLCNDQLTRSLTEVLNVAFGSLPINLICDLIKIDGSFVRQVVEKVVRRLGLWAALLVPEDQINPSVKILGNVL